VAAIAFLLVVQVVGTSATMTTVVCRRPQSLEATRPEMEERNSGWRRRGGGADRVGGMWMSLLGVFWSTKFNFSCSTRNPNGIG